MEKLEFIGFDEMGERIEKPLLEAGHQFGPHKQTKPKGDVIQVM